MLRPSAELVTIRIDGLAVGGDAVGRQVGGAHEGRTTFVPLAVPGETVRARLTREKARVAWAELDSVLSAPVAARVMPPCPLFGQCGGCQWQHVSLAVQRETKRAIVARALGLSAAEVPIRMPTPGGMGYRERVRLIVGRAGEIGLRMRRSHEVVAVPACGLLSEPLARVLSRLRSAPVRLPPGTEIDVQAGREGAHVRLRSSVAPEVDGQVPNHRFLGASWGAETWLESLRPAGVVGIVMVSRDLATSAAGAADVDVSESEAHPLRIPAGGFSQVGRAANAMLIETACDALGAHPGHILELYAGSGNFTRHLCARGLSVVAVDGDRAAVERGRRNAPAAEWMVAPSSAMPEAAPYGWAELTGGERRFDRVLVDPPRGGLDATALRLAVRARQRIVYVSCDPQTLGRDARELVRAGFALRSAIALDLMPHTFHVEVVALFERIDVPPG
jgi:23S rRNA (uracil1939-C5)-methyltransferase